MPSAKDSLTRKLNKIERQIRPPGSIAYNIHHLSLHDRAVYERWKSDSAAWNAARPGEQAYVDLLAAIEGIGEPLPALLLYVAKKIYPQPDGSGNAQQDYENLLEAMRCSM